MRCGGHFRGSTCSAEGKLTTEKWAKLVKVSHDTALRDIQDLIKKGILRQKSSGGRSTAYTLVHEEMDKG